MTRQPIFVLLILLCSPAFSTPLPGQPHVYVEGSAELEVAPDTITFAVSIQHVADDVAAAKAVVDKRSLQLIDLIREAGVQPQSISTTTLSISPYTEYTDGRRVSKGTLVSRQIAIELNDLEKYPVIIAALVEANISKTIRTTLSVSNEKELVDKALVAAMSDARARAEMLASSQGKSLGEPFSISEFMSRDPEERYTLEVSRRIEGQFTEEYLTLASGFSGEPFEPGLMVAKAQVFVVYLLQ